jgi:hypothetical protein
VHTSPARGIQATSRVLFSFLFLLVLLDMEMMLDTRLSLQHVRAYNLLGYLIKHNLLQ